MRTSNSEKFNTSVFVMKTPKGLSPTIAIAALTVLALTAATAMPATINVGDHLLIPNHPGQTIAIMVSGGEQVSGLNFFAQIGDGGPELADYGLPAGTDGPEFTAVDLKTATIFSGVSTNQWGGIPVPQIAEYSIITADTGSVAASGRLAALTIDTTGFFAGTWDLLLSGILGENTNFAPDPIDITNGKLSLAEAGDCNLDGMVNTADANTLAANWLRDDGVGWAQGDFNGDGLVDAIDATVMAANWSGPKQTPSQSVPEPSALALLVASILFVGLSVTMTYLKSMFHRYSALFCVLVILLAAAGRAEEKKSDSNVPVLKIPRLPSEVQIDGNLTEACYAQHKPLEDFRIAADSQHPAPQTRAWVFWREDKIVLAYECIDDKIVAAPKSGDEMDVDLQDRVELFLWNGRPQDAYPCLEMAPRGAVLDYSCKFYRRFDTSWNAVGLKVASVITANGYRTEAELPAAVARPFGIKFEKGASFRGGLFRGNRLSGDKQEEPMWITWVESGKKKPDFHIAESFGRFILVE